MVHLGRWHLSKKLIQSATLATTFGLLASCVSFKSKASFSSFAFDIDKSSMPQHQQQKPFSVMIIDSNFNDDASDYFLKTHEAVRVESLIKFKDPQVQMAWEEFSQITKGFYDENAMRHGTRVSSFPISNPDVKALTTVYRYDAIEMADFMSQYTNDLCTIPVAVLDYSNPRSTTADNKAYTLGLKAAQKLHVDGVNISIISLVRDMKNLPLFSALIKKGTLVTVSSGNDPTSEQVAPNFGFFASDVNKDNRPGKMLVIGMLSAEKEAQIVNEGNAAGDQQKYFFGVTGEIDFYGSSYASPAVQGLYLEEKLKDPALTPSLFYELLKLRAVDLGDPGVDSVFGQGAVFTGGEFCDVSNATRPKKSKKHGQEPLDQDAAPIPAELGPMSFIEQQPSDQYLLFSGGKDYLVRWAKDDAWQLR